MINTIINLDVDILLFIQEYLRNPILTPIFKVITSLGNGGFIWILICLILIINKKTRKVGYMSALALLGILFINNFFLKNLIKRMRPFDAISSLQLLIPRPSGFSFPSGHTASSFAAAFVIFRNLPKRYGIAALILASLIAISRLYFGVHYPSDVLFGIISGMLIGYLAEYIVNYVLKLLKE